MTYNGADAFVEGIGTVRECVDCGCLIAGGPTRCIRCVKEGKPGIGECPSTWQVFISGDDRMYTVEADYYHIEEDGSLAFFRLEECDKPRPVGIVAPLSWALARRLG